MSGELQCYIYLSLVGSLLIFRALMGPAVGGVLVEQLGFPWGNTVTGERQFLQ